MKITKLLALISFISVFAVSCSNDDNNTTPEITKISMQKEVESKFLTTGNYNYKHGNRVMPFRFTESTFTAASTKQDKPDPEFRLFKLYKSTEAPFTYKAILTNASGKFSILFIRNIKEHEMEINFDFTFEIRNFTSEEDAINTPYPHSNNIKPNHETEQFGWLKITKENNQTIPQPNPQPNPQPEPEPEPGTNIGFENLQGTFASRQVTTRGMNSQLLFKIVENEEEFIMAPMANMNLRRVHTDIVKGQIIYEITDATVYFSNRNGEYLTVYVRNISADGRTADFAIATKGGVKTVTNSQQNPIARTLEEAKTLNAPNENALWDFDMMEAANVWISTTKQ